MGDALGYLRDELAKLEANGLLLHPRTLEGPTGARSTFDGREVINLASNNYLGLASHPRMNRAAADAALELGAGSGAVRTIAGSMSMHRELERRFAEFKHAEAALMFQSGFTANAGTVAAILTPDDVIVSIGSTTPPSSTVHACRRRRSRSSTTRTPTTRTACSPRPRGRAATSSSSPTVCSRWTATSRRCLRWSRSPNDTAPS